jgi:hypothetical protein
MVKEIARALSRMMTENTTLGRRLFGILNGFTSVWNFDIKLITIAAGVFAKMNCTQISITWINHEKHYSTFPTKLKNDHKRNCAAEWVSNPRT